MMCLDTQYSVIAWGTYEAIVHAATGRHYSLLLHKDVTQSCRTHWVDSEMATLFKIKGSSDKHRFAIGQGNNDLYLKLFVHHDKLNV